MAAFGIGTVGKKYTNLSDYDTTTLLGPIQRMFAVNASDTLPLTNGSCRGLWVGVAGAAHLILEDGSTDGCDAGVVGLIAGYNPFACRQVFETSLTASGLGAVY